MVIGCPKSHRKVKPLGKTGIKIEFSLTTMKKAAPYQTFDKKVIRTYLNACDRAMLDSIATYLDYDDAFEQDNLVGKRVAITDVLAENQDTEVVEELKSYYEFYQQKKAEVDQLKKEVNALKESFKEKELELLEIKEDFDAEKIDRTNQFSKTFLDEEQIDIIQEKYERIDKIKQKNRATKIRQQYMKNGLKAYAKGIMAAVVEGTQTNYVNEANALANETIENTQAACKQYEKDGVIDVMTVDGFAALAESIDEILRPKSTPIEVQQASTKEKVRQPVRVR